MRSLYAILGLLGAFCPASAAVAQSGLSSTTSLITSRVTSTKSTATGSSGTATVVKSSTSSAKAANSSPSSVSAPYWLEQIKHQGVAAFNPSPGTYQVFRNVKDFGAKGDGITDDTAAIQNAMNYGGRCGAGCQSSTTTPAIVYFPSGTYMLSSSIQDYYYTQIIGNPNSLPVLKAIPGFSGFGLIDGDVYGPGGVLRFGQTNVFYRQIRNIVFDLTGIPPSSSITALHWPTAQATSLQNCVFKMSDAPHSQHTGLFIEGGSGGFMTDLVFYGGGTGVVFGNQQFTSRNLTFNNAVVAINQIWDWGWTYQGVTINNCTTGLLMSGGGRTGQSVGSVTFIDSAIRNTQVAFVTAHDSTSLPPTGGSLILENVSLVNVTIAVQGPTGVVLPGGTLTIAGWGQGHKYIPTGPTNFMASTTPFPRPASLLTQGKFYTRSKPQYESLPVVSFVSVRTGGAKGDGITDDTKIINQILASAAGSNLVIFFDAGTYKVTSTIFIPVGSKIVGESFSVIMGAGSFFSNIKSPQPVVSVGLPGQTGVVEWSDMIVSTQGATAGAILIQWNLASSATSPSGMWDVHTRVGGFAGSDLQLTQCPTTPTLPGTINQRCIAAFMSMYVAPAASGLYLENNWFWTADHDIDDPSLRQITIYSGRGFYSASSVGTIWMWGTSVEHHSLYQYQFVNTRNVYAGQIQTETAYWQPNPNATAVFPVQAQFNDPNFATSCVGVSGNCANGWGLRVVTSQNILIYGAGLYSFFNNYSTSCSNAVTPPGGNGASCQTRIFSIEGVTSKNIDVYNLNTIGSAQMITRDGKSLAGYADNVNTYQDTIAWFKSN